MADITPVTKVNIGILGALVSGGIVAGIYLASLNGTVDKLAATAGAAFITIDKQLTEIKTELRDGSAATALLNRAVAMIEAKLDAMEKRLSMLEAKAR